MYCNENGYADYLPVDIAVNAILACTWNYIYNKDHEKTVYNLTSSSEFKVYYFINWISKEITSTSVNVISCRTILTYNNRGVIKKGRIQKIVLKLM